MSYYDSNYEFNGRAVPSVLAGWTWINVVVNHDIGLSPIDVDNPAVVEDFLRGAARQSDLPETAWLDRSEDMRALIAHYTEELQNLGHIAARETATS